MYTYIHLEQYFIGKILLNREWTQSEIQFFFVWLKDKYEKLKKNKNNKHWPSVVKPAIFVFKFKQIQCKLKGNQIIQALVFFFKRWFCHRYEYCLFYTFNVCRWICGREKMSILLKSASMETLECHCQSLKMYVFSVVKIW